MDATPGPDRLPASADPLGEALHHFRMSGALYCRSELTAPWALDLPTFPDCLMINVVAAGECRVEVPGTGDRLLRAGDLALVPHGGGHRLASAPGVAAARLFDLPREAVSERYEVLRHGGGGAPATVLCGAVCFDHPAARRLVAQLPPLLVFDANETRRMDRRFESILDLMATEARALNPGGEAVITRLADILVIQAIRSWLEREPGDRTGWLAALRDRQIGRAIAQVHREPMHPWTVERLAASVAMSRSAFAERFTRLVGEPPMRYVARWRMELAVTWLRNGDAGLDDIAHRLAYQSGAAFSRAFKRIIGLPPGAVRRAGEAADTSGVGAALH